MGDHGEGRAIVTVGQVDDVGDGREHSTLAAGTNGRALLTHGQKQLEDLGQELKPRHMHHIWGAWTLS